MFTSRPVQSQTVQERRGGAAGGRKDQQIRGSQLCVVNEIGSVNVPSSVGNNTDLRELALGGRRTGPQEVRIQHMVWGNLARD